MKNTKPRVERGQDLEATIFGGGRKEMSRAELLRVLAPAVARWIKAACVWEDAAMIGDYRYVIFEIGVAPQLDLYVQFWSEPGEPVLWEVSSGRWHPPAAEWLAGDRSRRIEAFGFEIGGDAGNYRQEVDVQTPADTLRIARTVVDIFYSAFDFRGRRPIKARLAYESRADMRLVYDSFTPEDLTKVFESCGFRVEEVEDDDDEPVLRAVRRNIVTTITCLDRVPDQHLFRRVMLTSDVEPPGGARAIKAAVQAAFGEADFVQLGLTLVFEGGVTAGWLVGRVEEWDALMWSSRRASRRRTKQTVPRTKARVH